MTKQDMVYKYRLYSSIEKESNCTICDHKDGPRKYCAGWR